MGLNVTILPVVTKDLPVSPRFTPYDYLSQCKFSALTTCQPMVEFYLLVFSHFSLLLRKKKHEFWFDKNRTHDFCTSRCAGYLLDVTVKCVLNNDTITQRTSKHNCTSQCSPLHLQRISQPQARWNAISELNERDHDHDRSGRAPRRKGNVAPLYGNSRGEGDARRNHQAPSARATPARSAAKGSKGVAHQPAAVQGKGDKCGAECGGTKSAAALMSKSREQKLEREAKAKEDREKLKEIRKVI